MSEVSRAARFAGLAIALAALLLVHAPFAGAAATVVSPAEGQTVTLDKLLRFSASWTMAPGESGPAFYYGTSPVVDVTNGLNDFSELCGADSDPSVTTSCTPAPNYTVVQAGDYYGFVATTTPDDFDPIVSPVVRFTVPTRVGFGCPPVATGCKELTTQNLYSPFGDSTYNGPYTTFMLRGWSNAPTTRIEYTIKHGRHVVKRLRKSISVADDTFVKAGLNVYKLPGVRPGTRLTCLVKLVSPGASASYKARLTAGGGHRHGLHFFKADPNS